MKNSYNGKAIPPKASRSVSAAVNCKCRTRRLFRSSKGMYGARHLESVSASV